MRFAVICVAGLMLIFVFSCSDTKLPDENRDMEKTATTDFTLKDYKGEPFTLNKQKGKPVLLIFITTWCPTCRTEIPHYKKIYETYGKRGLEVAMIDIQESREKVSAFAARYQIPFRILLDEAGDVAASYSVAGVPTMMLFDAKSTLISRDYTAIDILLSTMSRGN